MRSHRSQKTIPTVDVNPAKSDCIEMKKLDGPFEDAKEEEREPCQDGTGLMQVNVPPLIPVLHAPVEPSAEATGQPSNPRTDLRKPD